jgi:hypothetical protein
MPAFSVQFVASGIYRTSHAVNGGRDMTEETSTQKAEKTAKKSEDAAFVTWQQISTFSGTYGAVALSWTGLKELFGSDSWAGETWVAYLLGLMILLGVAVFSYKEEI